MRVGGREGTAQEDYCHGLVVDLATVEIDGRRGSDATRSL